MTLSPSLLQFTLPDFFRIAWTSDSARDAWAHKLGQLTQLLRVAEWTSVASGVRPCAELRMSRNSFITSAKKWSELGLACVALPQAEASSDSDHLQVALGAPSVLNDYIDALQRGAHDEVGRLLGYPVCCRDSFLKRIQRADFRDPIWWIVNEQTPTDFDATVVDLEVYRPLTNIFLRRMGLMAIFHVPCSFQCLATEVLAHQILQSVAASANSESHISVLSDLLHWPMEWSGLHGIAEIKTPIFRVSTRTDATANRVTFRLRGTLYPREGARGVRFPFNQSTKFAPVAPDSRALIMPQ